MIRKWILIHSIILLIYLKCKFSFTLNDVWVCEYILCVNCANTTVQLWFVVYCMNLYLQIHDLLLASPTSIHDQKGVCVPIILFSTERLHWQFIFLKIPEPSTIKQTSLLVQSGQMNGVLPFEVGMQKTDVDFCPLFQILFKGWEGGLWSNLCSSSRTKVKVPESLVCEVMICNANGRLHFYFFSIWAIGKLKIIHDASKIYWIVFHMLLDMSITMETVVWLLKRWLPFATFIPARYTMYSHCMVWRIRVEISKMLLW